MNNNTAVFPGSFDPLTKGHVNMINRALQLFDTIIIAIGVNESKKYMFNITDRIHMIESVFKGNQKVVIKKYSGLTIQFCKDNNTNTIIRGIRNNADFEYEKNIALANYELAPEIETLLLVAGKEYQFISSTIVKDIINNQGPLDNFLPIKIINYINEK